MPPTAGPHATDCETLVLGLFENAQPLPDCLVDSPAGATVRKLVEARDLPTGLGDCTPLFAPEGFRADSLLLVGLGPQAKFGPGQAYAAGFAVAKRLGGRARGHVAILLPGGPTAATTDPAFVQGLLAASKGPGLFKSEPNRFPLSSLAILAEPAGRLVPTDTEALARHASIVGEAIGLARELVNTPPAEKSPTRLARRMAEVGSAAGLAVEVWDEPRIRAERLGGLLGVAAGSDEPPAFVQLGLNLAAGDRPALALVGKGVTFDSGGLSLKPSASMEDMKADMAGGAAVFASMVAAARLGLKAPVRGFIPLTENMTGGRAMKLGDVLTIRNGTTIEVLNTDAEGRLILADALSLAAEQAPGRIVDLATLTGACLVALGTKVAGLFANDDDLASDLQAATRATGERLWRLPLDDDYRDLLKSQVADLKNIGGKWGGAITAAKFLETFVGSTPWAHLDIAGPSWADSDSPTQDAGGTGCFVRTLVALIEQTPTA